MKFVINSKPCMTEDGKIIATARLGKHIEISRSYELLRAKFADAKCSEKLGIIKINYMGKTVMVFRNGKISIRKAEDENDAIETIKKVTEVL